MNRRLILLLIAGAVVLPRMTRSLPARQATRRRLRLVNPHSGETFNGLYRDDYGPLATAMADLSVFLRDFHSGATVGIDVAVIDFLAAVMDAVDAQSAAILSAYRTPETNAMLARTTFGVAENSQHLYGRALDIRFGSRLAEAMFAARAMQRGGVGWYPHSEFLHIDTGPVRNWDLDENGLGSLLFDGQRCGVQHPCGRQLGRGLEQARENRSQARSRRRCGARRGSTVSSAMRRAVPSAPSRMAPPG
jgi:uncharacterized protein YcbK (DUF882 family)